MPPAVRKMRAACIFQLPGPMQYSNPPIRGSTLRQRPEWLTCIILDKLILRIRVAESFVPKVGKSPQQCLEAVDFPSHRQSRPWSLGSTLAKDSRSFVG